MDPISKMKETARETWGTFVPFEVTTGTVAPRLVRFAGVHPGARVLDVACGTGVVALSAARAGAKVEALDLSPGLLARAAENVKLTGVDVALREGDVEELPFDDESFDFVLSQFGHMFGPRPDRTLEEMLRVLSPGGVIAFSTWPPELFTGQMFALIGRYSPPPPPGVPPPTAWGEPTVVRERLGDRVEDLCFDRGLMRFPTLSPAHMRVFMEQNAAPITNLVRALEDEPERLAAYRRDLEELVERYFEDNIVRQDFLMSRARKR